MVDLAVVPVAGQGTRLLPSTKSQPKEMLPVGRKPVVQYVVEELARSGVKRLLFVTGAGKTSIENHFDHNVELIDFLRETGREDLLVELEFERMGLDYFYTRQRKQLGLGHAVLCARPLVGNQSFVVALGDSIIGMNAQSRIVARMAEEFERARADAIIAFEEVPREDVVQYGIAKPREESGAGGVFQLADIVEKPGVAEAPSNLAVAARYILKEAFAVRMKPTGDLDANSPEVAIEELEIAFEELQVMRTGGGLGQTISSNVVQGTGTKITTG